MLYAPESKAKFHPLEPKPTINVPPLAFILRGRRSSILVRETEGEFQRWLAQESFSARYVELILYTYSIY